ncbi:MAG: class I SAM-dependent methyltransferase, partial [Gammaproteobacteria bacterium]
MRIGVKIVLARLPVPYRIWKQLRIFEHGEMNQPRMALDTFLEYARTAGVLDTESNPPRIWVEGDNVNVLEIGPGDSLFTAVIAHALGASRTWLVDAAPFATTDMPGYAALFELLRQTGLA